MNPHLLLAAAEGYPESPVARLLDPRSDSQPRSDLQRLDCEPSTNRQGLPGGDSLPPRVLARLADPGQLNRTIETWQRAAASIGAHVLTPGCPTFPGALHDYPLRPRVLFALGDIGLLDASRPAVAIVGSRTPTPYGISAAQDFSACLSQAGIVVWSGLAYGIDAAAHRATLEHQGPTVAVLAGAIDRVYPMAHEELARQIVAAGGLILSEAPPGLRARRGHFLRRNRILAAATTAVLVVEAGLTSGSLQTARLAAEVGTAVFAVPGPYRSCRSRGCHGLIGDGAQLAQDPEDLIRRLGIEHRQEIGQGTLDRSADEATVLQLLQVGPRPMDLLLRESRLPAERFLIAVMHLQSRGEARPMPGDLLAPTRPGRRTQ